MCGTSRADAAAATAARRPRSSVPVESSASTRRGLHAERSGQRARGDSGLHMVSAFGNRRRPTAPRRGPAGTWATLGKLLEQCQCETPRAADGKIHHCALVIIYIIRPCYNGAPV